MKRFLIKQINLSDEKNDLLRKIRDISFEDVKIAMSENKVVDIQESHYNEKKYPNQKLLFVDINNYIYIVPFIEDETQIFLKTIIPTRKYTKIFLNK